MKAKIRGLLQKANLLSNAQLIEVDIEQYVEKICKSATIISIHQDDFLCAFIAYYDNDPQKEMAYLSMIVVDIKCQGMGFGRNLLQTAINNLEVKRFRKFKLEVRKDNAHALNLYKKMGFFISQIKNTSIYMIKEL